MVFLNLVENVWRQALYLKLLAFVAASIVALLAAYFIIVPNVIKVPCPSSRFNIN